MSTTGLPVVLGKMEWMSNSYLQCQQGTLMYSFVERMYENWKEILGLDA